MRGLNNTHFVICLHHTLVEILSIGSGWCFCLQKKGWFWWFFPLCCQPTQHTPACSGGSLDTLADLGGQGAAVGGRKWERSIPWQISTDGLLIAFQTFIGIMAVISFIGNAIHYLHFLGHLSIYDHKKRKKTKQTITTQVSNPWGNTSWNPILVKVYSSVLFQVYCIQRPLQRHSYAHTFATIENKVLHEVSLYYETNGLWHLLAKMCHL